MKIAKKALSIVMAVLMVLSCWVWAAPEKTAVANAATKDHYLFAYFTGNSSAGQTVHLAVSEDGLHYTALRNNEPVIIPSKGTGAVRDPYLWFDDSNDEGYYYLIGTDMDSSAGWSDCCNGFIIWRSKDLVHWTDETFISAYDILHKIDPNITNVKKAWAPQIMHDGNSYIVYFSLETNLSNEKLSIVYLKTDDLLKQEKYGNFGTIYAPADTSVNDAEIVKYNNEWYLFYKREGVSPERIFMRKASSYTGFANSSVNLDVFSSKQEALEGANGFFKPDGTFILYADAYWHDNNPNVPYFYAATTKDFNSWNVLDESSHNINSLSPRHGSVVAITEAEYNNLLLYTQNISSSAFAEGETVISHLVARYFTTDNVKYNAAPGKEREDLTVKNGLETTATNENGVEYYANFSTSQYATVDLNALLPDSFNYNDGFTITFKAKPRGAANSRFFSIKNGTTSTDITCWGGNSGLFACVNDAVVEATSAYYNDGKYHDYMITYANGNLIVYVDGNLLIKENRFTVSTMNNAWFEALGNGTLAIGAYDSGAAAINAAISDFRLYDCALSYYDVQRTALELEIASGQLASASIVVPETVYMFPSTGTTKRGQYYVNNEINMSNGQAVVVPEVLSSNTNGYIQFYLPGAKDVKIAVNTLTSGVGDIVFYNSTDIAADKLSGSNENISYASLIDNTGFFEYKAAGLYINGTGLSAGNTAVAEWVFTITMEDGSENTYYAYSTLYAPYYQPVGAAVRPHAKNGCYAASFAWISGVHGFIRNNDANNKYYIAVANYERENEGENSGRGNRYPTTSFVPMIYGVASASNNTTGSDNKWFSSSSSTGLTDPSIRYISFDSGKDGVTLCEVSPIATITVDTSRYENFNEIPNVRVGFNFNDNENSKSTYWYVSDFTDIAHTTAAKYSNTTDPRDYDIMFLNWSKKHDGNDFDWEPKLFNGNSTGYIYKGNATSTSSVNTGVEYDEQYNREIVKGTDTYDYIFKGASHTYGKNGLYEKRAYGINFVQLRATNTDKGALRKMVLEGASYAQQNYTTDSWNTFQTRLREAATALGNPTASAIATTNLDNAIEALATPVKFVANGGKINGADEISFGGTVGSGNTCSIALSDYIPTHEDHFTFMGWATSATATNGILSTITAGFNPPTFYAVWTVNSKALSDDKLIMDFDGFKHNPFGNDGKFDTYATSMGKKYSLLGVSTSDKDIVNELNVEYGSFAVDGNDIVYYVNPANIYTNSFNAYNSVWYHATIDGNDNLLNPIYKSFEVAPASNVLFEDTRFVTVSSENDTNTPWTAEGKSAVIRHEDNVYGYNSSYTGNVGKYSNGTALVTTVDENNKRSQIQSFTFTGTGFDLYGQCGANTGIMVITVKDSEGNAVKASVVDTYYNDSTYGTLNQITIAGARDLPHDTYTVQVAAMYMSIAGAVKGAQNAYGLRDMVSFASPMSTADMLYDTLCEVGLEEVFEVDDLEINWFDEGSVLNGGNGASTYALGDEGQTAATRTATTLVNVIDSIRVYNPLNPEFADNYYVASEKGAKYFNVMDNLNNNGIVSGNGTFTYVNYDPDAENDQATITPSSYDTKGSNEEFYLTSNITNGLVFTVNKPDAASRVMISLRAAAGSPVAKIGSKVITLNSSTEMYYDITEYLGDGGTVAIQNNGDGLLAIGNVKVTNCPDAEPVMMSTFNMRSARMMMMAPPAADEPEVEETTTEEVTTEETTTEEVTTEEATTEETTTEEVTTEETTTEAPSTEEPTTPDADEDSNEVTKESFLEKINGLIDFIVSLIKKIFSAIDFMQNI